MRRRVEELLLLARASAGQRAPRTDIVELDGLALECADLMRAGPRRWGGASSSVGSIRWSSRRASRCSERRSSSCWRTRVVTAVVVRRFASPSTATADDAVIEVANGAAERRPWLSETSSGSGLGLQVVRYIAHGARRAAGHHRSPGGLACPALHIPVERRSRPTGPSAVMIVATCSSRSRRRRLAIRSRWPSPVARAGTRGARRRHRRGGRRWPEPARSAHRRARSRTRASPTPTATRCRPITSWSISRSTGCSAAAATGRPRAPA